jgi:hypothetical protein
MKEPTMESCRKYVENSTKQAVMHNSDTLELNLSSSNKTLFSSVLPDKHCAGQQL